MEKNESPKLDDSGTGRKVYRSPQVRVYGNIRDITQTVGPVGKVDNADPSMVLHTSL